MSIHACPCLNVKVRTAPGTPVSPSTVGTPPAGGEESRVRGHLPYVKETGTVKGYRAQLGLGGITIEHRLLLKNVLHDEGRWLEARCANCGCSVYFIRFDPRSHTLSDLAANTPADGILIIGENTIFDAAIEKDKQAPTYSEACRIILMNNHAKPEHTPTEYGLAEAYESFEKSLNRFQEAKRIEMEERIAAFRREQETILERQRERSRRDADILWARICNLHRDRLHRTATPSPNHEKPESPTSATTASLPTPNTPAPSLPSEWHGTSPVIGSFYQRAASLSMSTFADRRKSVARNAHPSTALSSNGERSDESARRSPSAIDQANGTSVSMEVTITDDNGTISRKVHFDQHVPESRTAEPENVLNVPSNDDEAIFDLDGFDDDSKEKQKPPPILTDEEEDEVEDSPEAPEPPSASIFSSSLPIRIPSIHRLDSLPTEAPIPEESEPVNDDDSEQFIAPHILSAKTYTEDYLMNQRPPKSRKTSFAI